MSIDLLWVLPAFIIGVIVGGIYEAFRSQRVVRKYGKWTPYD